MDELHELESELAQRLAQTTFDDLVRDEHQAALRTRVLAAYDETGRRAALSPWKRRLEQGRALMRRPISQVVASAAACLAVIALWIFAPGKPRAAHAFEMFAEALVEAKSATFQTEVRIDGQAKQVLESSYLTPGRLRNEMKGVINVFDMRESKIITLLPDRKSATIMNLQNVPKEPGKLPFNDVFERTRALLAKARTDKDAKFEPLGEKEIDGRRALGFRQASALHVMTLWGDPATGMPVLVEVAWSGVPRTEVTLSHFKLNAKLNKELFDIAAPADYKVHSVDVDLSPPSEAKFIETVRKVVELNDGQFPDQLDTASTYTLLLKKAAGNAKEPGKDMLPEVMQQAVTMSRGLVFALQLPEPCDAHYAGKGVKLDQPDRPVFWYKPEGGQGYRVFYADLTVRDSDDAPAVEGAVRVQAPQPARTE